MNQFVTMGFAIASVIGTIIYSTIGYQLSLQSLLNDTENFTIIAILLLIIVGSISMAAIAFIETIKKRGFEGSITVAAGFFVLVAAVFSIVATYSGIVFLVLFGIFIYSFVNSYR